MELSVTGMKTLLIPVVGPLISINCSPDNLVTALGAPSQGLSGTLFGMIANLTNLRQVDLEVDYESDEKAQIVYTSLVVDKELQPDKVKRLMSVSNGKLSVHFEAVEARFLRASFSAFTDVLTLATKTIEQFSIGMDL